MNNPIENLINQLSRLPGIGSKSAQRLAYYIIDLDEVRVNELADSIKNAKNSSRLCSICNNITDVDPCVICNNDHRDDKTICVVENPKDVISIEKAGKYRGVCHVLHGDIISSEDGELKITGLLERIRDNEVKEVILALNPNISGEASLLYLSQILKPLGINVTRIAYGLPYGGDMDYFDGETINFAIANRREV